jgi:hypothetical protein
MSGEQVHRLAAIRQVCLLGMNTLVTKTGAQIEIASLRKINLAAQNTSRYARNWPRWMEGSSSAHGCGSEHGPEELEDQSISSKYTVYRIFNYIALRLRLISPTYFLLLVNWFYRGSRIARLPHAVAMRTELDYGLF